MLLAAEGMHSHKLLLVSLKRGPVLKQILPGMRPVESRSSFPENGAVRALVPPEVVLFFNSYPWKGRQLCLTDQPGL